MVRWCFKLKGFVLLAISSFGDKNSKKNRIVQLHVCMNTTDHSSAYPFCLFYSSSSYFGALVFPPDPLRCISSMVAIFTTS
ncbi:hypothetical protein PF005_g7434 [Phytophthora fragariae]|uniref:Secreted protein n=1 Tax=Phytophthora fragariae TaxID=53985 RepID=A0A6A3YKG5_9STRA|nr:hypothetical protein PF003_g37529 [Phytophthora fragariae]KAE8942389.1 hypothetical protein PF009_g7838 [Phytophthora fragariae]KAE9018704.1 hypothetical protein PF011_g6149 [Phytophthora fragariae]KAE9122285.1 hypothetical protein PF007_g7503 [Phytophthora fragariae]KAE9123080.1 hypothetical protein PF010_g6537 [Phytophthora fragariae]